MAERKVAKCKGSLRNQTNAVYLMYRSLRYIQNKTLGLYLEYNDRLLNLVAYVFMFIRDNAHYEYCYNYLFCGLVTNANPQVQQTVHALC